MVGAINGDNKNISQKDESMLFYQLKKFEVLMKRRAGQYCVFDYGRNKIIPSGEQKTHNEYKIAKNKQTKKVIDWLKKANAILQKEDPLGGKILVNSKANARKTKNNFVSV
ncbi:hypothetical protein [endosymbiont GvMRE of Glomus versiforme]|uniref:hypothetical protein n=1 Tax=endosymbiont GvMRE of Glomus versiforme TaxID=2039283 RepID=UPI000EC1C4F6|nr:hypothetical protein [endosymbiont GvMRE of Glomus versiforme]RHZ36148.1 hypothetical protein GvMRE_Ic2g130 [endosymbiont GvMRE of Glomus versiforme]